LYFTSAAVTYLQIANLYEVGQRILLAYKEKRWRKNFVLISRIIQGANTIIVISGSDDCNVIIEAKNSAVKKINLADAKMDLQFSKSHQVNYKIISKENCGIGFGISKVYNPLFNGPSFKKFKSNPKIFNALDLDEKVDHNNLAFGDVFPSHYDEV
jgi:hypothetical protein